MSSWVRAYVVSVMVNDVNGFHVTEVKAKLRTYLYMSYTALLNNNNAIQCESIMSCLINRQTNALR